MGKHCDWLSEETATGNCFTNGASPGTKYPADFQRSFIRPRLAWTLDLEVPLFVRWEHQFNAEFIIDFKAIRRLELLRIFYGEHMVDHATFLSWLVQTMVTCNLAQAGFAARLMDDFHSDLYTCRALTRPLVEACLMKLQEVRFLCMQLHYTLIYVIVLSDLAESFKRYPRWPPW